MLTFAIATVWFVNGFVCKVLQLVPRHEQIVARILGNNHASLLTILIGISEILMAIWVLTKFTPKLNAIAQISLVASMNMIECVWAADLLLWGRLNAVFALLFICVVYYNEFVLTKHINLQKTS